MLDRLQERHNALVSSLILGVVWSVWHLPLFALLQAIVPADKQGRVFTILVSGGSLIVPIGLAIAGPVVEALGILSWFLFRSAMSLIMGIGGLFIPALRNMEAEGVDRIDQQVSGEAAIDAV
jgi:membrane protease YdiL (CAAX protease family)